MSTPRKSSGSMSQNTKDIWGEFSVPSTVNLCQKRAIHQELSFYEDQLDKHESMLALVNLLDQSGELPCSDDADLPVWPILSSLQSPVIAK